MIKVNNNIYLNEIPLDVNLEDSQIDTLIRVSGDFTDEDMSLYGLIGKNEDGEE